MLYLPLISLIVLFAASAQAELPNVSTERLNTTTGFKIRVENNASSDIVAMHFAADCPRTQKHVAYRYDDYFDVYARYGFNGPISPGKFFGIALPSRLTECPGDVDAVIFADGKTIGNKDEVNRLLQRRKGVKAALEIANPLVDAIATRARAPMSVVMTLKAMRASVAVDGSLAPATRDGELFTLDILASLLASQQVWVVPSDLTPQRKPGVEQVMRDRGLPREQAHALVMSRKIAEWREDLIKYAVAEDAVASSQ